MELYIYGGGGHAKVILDILHKQNRPVAGIVDDLADTNRGSVHGIPVQPVSKVLEKQQIERTEWIIAVGNNSTRRTIAERLAARGYQFTNAVHPSAQIALGVTLGSGTVVMANSVINTDAQIGEHAIVNTGATIDHDCIIKDYAHIAPGSSLCGQVQIGEGAFLGVGTKVRPQIHVGSWTVCGAGSVLVNSLPPGVLAYGCPAKIQSS